MAKSITIIGAGPTGLSAALALASRGHGVRILERNESSVKESRAVGVNLRSMKHLETVGVADSIRAHAVPLRRVRFFSNGRPLAYFELPLVDGVPAMLALPQSTTEVLLLERLRKFGVEPEWSTQARRFEQNGHGVEVFAEGPSGKETIRADFVLGADGVRSIVRETLGVAFPGKTYDGQWALFDAEVDWPYDKTDAAVHFFRDGNVMLLIDLGDGRHRIIGNVPNMEDRVRGIMGVGDVSWRNDFTLSERRAEHYGEGRVWLAGDAAHVHSPVGGQGMNLGIDDAFDFAATIDDGLDFAGYETRRIPAAKRAMALADRGVRLVTSPNPVVRLFRNAVIRLVANSRLARRMLATRLAASS